MLFRGIIGIYRKNVMKQTSTLTLTLCGKREKSILHMISKIDSWFLDLECTFVSEET